MLILALVVTVRKLAGFLVHETQRPIRLPMETLVTLETPLTWCSATAMPQAASASFKAVSTLAARSTKNGSPELTTDEVILGLGSSSKWLQASLDNPKFRRPSFVLMGFLKASGHLG